MSTKEQKNRLKKKKPKQKVQKEEKEDYEMVEKTKDAWWYMSANEWLITLTFDLNINKLIYLIFYILKTVKFSIIKVNNGRLRWELTTSFRQLKKKHEDLSW